MSEHMIVRAGEKELKFLYENAFTQYRIDTFYTKEPETIKWIDSFEPNATMWDIGANIGIYTCYAAVVKGTHVVAFEPLPFNMNSLATNILLNKINHKVTVFTAPLTNRPHIGPLNMGSCSPAGSGSTFSEIYTADGNPIEKSVPLNMFGFSADSLYDLFHFSPPNYIKIDVDGIEHLILAGMKKVLSHPDVKSVLVELFDDFKEQVDRTDFILKKNGFELIEVGKSPLYTEGFDSHVHNYIYRRV